MSKANVTKMMKGVKKGIIKHAPELLTGIGIAGMISTTILAVKATPKAVKLIEEKKAEEKKEKLTPVETVKTTWKCYAPAAITGVAAIGCIIGGTSVSARRNAALVTAYNVTKHTLSEFKEKAVETVGEKKVQAIKDKMAKDAVEKNPVSTKEVYITNKGETLCYDSTSGRYFKSDLEKIRKVVNDLNARMAKGCEEYISLNEFYSELGLKETDLGDLLGWNIGDSMIELDYSAQLAEDGTPCIVIAFEVAPRYDYHRLM